MSAGRSGSNVSPLTLGGTSPLVPAIALDDGGTGATPDDDDDLEPPTTDTPYTPHTLLGSLQVLKYASLVRGEVLTGDVSKSRAPDTLENFVSEGPPREIETHDPRHQSAANRPSGHPYHALSGS